MVVGTYLVVDLLVHVGEGGGWGRLGEDGQGIGVVKVRRGGVDLRGWELGGGGSGREAELIKGVVGGGEVYGLLSVYYSVVVDFLVEGREGTAGVGGLEEEENGMDDAIGMDGETEMEDLRCQIEVNVVVIQK